IVSGALFGAGRAVAGRLVPWTPGRPSGRAVLRSSVGRDHSCRAARQALCACRSDAVRQVVAGWDGQACWSPSVVVIGPTQVVVDDGKLLRGFRRQRLLIELVLEDRVDGFVAGGADVQRSAAGSLQALHTVRLRQPQNAETGTEALLRVAATGEDLADQLSGGGPAL